MAVVLNCHLNWRSKDATTKIVFSKFISQVQKTWDLTHHNGECAIRHTHTLNHRHTNSYTSLHTFWNMRTHLSHTHTHSHLTYQHTPLSYTLYTHSDTYSHAHRHTDTHLHTHRNLFYTIYIYIYIYIYIEHIYRKTNWRQAPMCLWRIDASDGVICPPHSELNSSRQRLSQLHLYCRKKTPSRTHTLTHANVLLPHTHTHTHKTSHTHTHTHTVAYSQCCLTSFWCFLTLYYKRKSWMFKQIFWSHSAQNSR